MGRMKTTTGSGGGGQSAAIEAKSRKSRESAKKSYREDSDSEEEEEKVEEEVDDNFKPDPKDKDFSDEELNSASEEDSGSEWGGDDSGSEYGSKKKKKSPVKKGRPAVGGRGRKAASPKGKRGRGRPPAASNGGKKAVGRKPRKADSEEESVSDGGSSGSEYGKKKKAVTPKKATPTRKAVLSPRKRKAASPDESPSSPAARGRARRDRKSSKSYKDLSDEEIDELVVVEEQPKAKRAKVELKDGEKKEGRGRGRKPKEVTEKEKESTGEEDEPMDEEEEDEEEAKTTEKSVEKAEPKKNGTAASEKVQEKKEEEDESEEEKDKDEESSHSSESDEIDGDNDNPAPEKDGLKNKSTTDFTAIDFAHTSKKSPKGDSCNFKIACWNIGGIKSWLKKDGLEYLKREDADIVCLNEIKCNEKTKPKEVENVEKYPHLYWSYNAENSGHHGVAVFSKVEAKHVQIGFPEKDSDSASDKKSKISFSKEGRMLTLEFDHFYLINAYVPNGGRAVKTDKFPKGYPPKVAGGERQMFDKMFREYVIELEEKKPVIVAGDLNVAHEEIDLANPKTNDKTAGFTKEEREGMAELLDKTSLFDTFRELNPDKKAYTFWSYMHNSRAKNIGWRLDYFLMSEDLKDGLCDCVMRSEVYGSDHCPIVLSIHKP